MILALALLLGYLVGGIPTGILICRTVAGIDPRTIGSGSSGATNVSRVIGRNWAMVVLLLDALKGLLAVVFLVPLLSASGHFELVRVAIAIGVVLGHIWTPYANFRGGKGVATAAGALLALDAWSVGVALGIWLLVFLLFRRVSVASLAGGITVPATMLILGNRASELVFGSIVLSLLLVYTHRTNIQRILAGHEKPIV